MGYPQVKEIAGNSPSPTERIEFNDCLRHIDVISDLTFLLMDLDFNNSPNLGDTLLDEYLKYTNDLNAVPMLDFYKCYRAMVRCKVNCIFLQSQDLLKEEKKPFIWMPSTILIWHTNMRSSFSDSAFGWSAENRPGKSTIAKELSEILGIKVIRSDVVRKQIFGLKPHDHGAELVGEKLYASHATSLTYGKLLCRAQEEIFNGTSVILDATYSKAEHRREVTDLAKDKGVIPVFIECTAKDKILKDRLLERQFHPSASDARIDQFEKLNAGYERFRSAENALHIRVDTALPLGDIMRKILIRAFRMNSNLIMDRIQTKKNND